MWRLRPYSVTRGPAYCEDRARAHFTFSILGNDAPLITKPEYEPSPSHIADETNVPAFIRRRGFADHLAAYYGPGKSLCIYRGPAEVVPLDEIVAADLSDWRYVPRRGQVAVDPVLGRIAFPSRHAPDAGVWVTYHYGFSDDLGGGEYHRPLTPRTADYVVGEGGQFERIMAAVEQWQEDKVDDPTKRQAVIELAETTAYQEQIEIRLDYGDRLTLRAAQAEAAGDQAAGLVQQPAGRAADHRTRRGRRAAAHSHVGRSADHRAQRPGAGAGRRGRTATFDAGARMEPRRRLQPRARGGGKRRTHRHPGLPAGGAQHPGHDPRRRRRGARRAESVVVVEQHSRRGRLRSRGSRSAGRPARARGGEHEQSDCLRRGARAYRCAGRKLDPDGQGGHRPPTDRLFPVQLAATRISHADPIPLRARQFR